MVETLLAAVVSGAFGLAGGALISRMTLQRSAAEERRAQRLNAADAILPGVRLLRQMLRELPTNRDAARWVQAVAELFAAMDGVITRLPDSWGHLERSLRAALGEVVGPVAVSDIDPEMREFELAEYSRQWAMHAEEYFAYAIHRVELWRDDPKRGDVAAPELLSFDGWLYAHDLSDYRPFGQRRRRILR